MIPLFDLSIPPDLLEPIQTRVSQQLAEQDFILGDSVATFERDFARYCSAEWALGLASGTDALVIAMRSLGIGPGDEVVVPALSFYASAETVALIGAPPVFVDVDDSFCIDPDKVEAMLSERSKAILPVHLYGCPANMDALRRIADGHQLYLIEDAAQAVGASWNQQALGSLSDAACYSFYPTKNLGAAGDAGALTSNSKDLIERAKILRVHGTTAPYYHEALGYTSRLDAIQATVLHHKLTHLDKWNDGRRQLAHTYDQAFDDLTSYGIHRQRIPSKAHAVYHLYVLSVPERDRFMGELEARGVSSRPYYPHPLCDLPPMRAFPNDGAPNARHYAESLLAIPIYPQLSTEGQERVIEAVWDVARQ